MAYSTEAVEAALITHAGNDKPLLDGYAGQQDPNAVNRVPVQAEWNTLQDLGNPNDNDPAYPAARVHDRAAALRSRHLTATGGGAGSDKFFLFEFTTPGITFDGVALVGHNLKALSFGGASAGVTVRVANAANFAGAVAIANWPGPFTTSRRLADLSLSPGTTRYKDVIYLALEFSKVVAGIVQLGEVWLLRRSQMPYWPQNPWTPEHKLSRRELFAADSGHVTTYTYHSGRGEQQMSMEFPTQAEADVLDTFWARTDQGRRRGLFLPTPGSDPTEAWICSWPEPGLLKRSMSPLRKSYELRLVEDAPFVEGET